MVSLLYLLQVILLMRQESENVFEGRADRDNYFQAGHPDYDHS
jgi:hypothetical protein